MPQQTTQIHHMSMESVSAKLQRTPRTQHHTGSVQTGKQELRGQGRRTHNTAHRAGTPVNGSKVAKDIKRTTQDIEGAQQ